MSKWRLCVVGGTRTETGKKLCLSYCSQIVVRVVHLCECAVLNTFKVIVIQYLALLTLDVGNITATVCHLIGRGRYQPLYLWYLIFKIISANYAESLLRLYKKYVTHLNCLKPGQEKHFSSQLSPIGMQCSCLIKYIVHHLLGTTCIYINDRL